MPGVLQFMWHAVTCAIAVKGMSLFWPTRYTTLNPQNMGFLNAAYTVCLRINSQAETAA